MYRTILGSARWLDAGRNGSSPRPAARISHGSPAGLDPRHRTPLRPTAQRRARSRGERRRGGGRGLPEGPAGGIGGQGHPRGRTRKLRQRGGRGDPAGDGAGNGPDRHVHTRSHGDPPVRLRKRCLRGAAHRSLLRPRRPRREADRIGGRQAWLSRRPRFDPAGDSEAAGRPGRPAGGGIRPLPPGSPSGRWGHPAHLLQQVSPQKVAPEDDYRRLVGDQADRATRVLLPLSPERPESPGREPPASTLPPVDEPSVDPHATVRTARGSAPRSPIPATPPTLPGRSRPGRGSTIASRSLSRAIARAVSSDLRSPLE